MLLDSSSESVNNVIHDDNNNSCHAMIESSNLHCNQNEISIAWKSLQFEVNDSVGALFCHQNKKILQNLNGFFEYNSLNALMGPSGAGKTSLLNILSGNDRSGLSKKSKIYLNSKEKSPISYFIQQHVHESIVGRMTVLEIFRYAYKFKNKSSNSNAQMEEHILTVMTELMLPLEILSRNFSQCSGGEQKRIAIGQELMTLNKPTFLFADELTTGLDSTAAFEVIKCLKQLTEKYRITVITSIHAPNNETLSLFDKLYVLSKGGACIYSGSPNLIQSKLEEHIQVKIPDQQPPIEALIQIACNGIQNRDVIRLSEKCLISERHHLTSHQIDLTHHKYGLPVNCKAFTLSDFFLQLVRLLQINFISDNRIFMVNIVAILVFYFLMATMFNSQNAKPSACVSLVSSDDNSTTSTSTKVSCAKSDIYENSLVLENMHFLAYSLMFVGYIMVVFSAQFFLPIVKVFRNEHRNHWYSSGVFYWSSLIFSLVQVTFLAIVISFVSYFFTNQHLADDYEINWNRLLYYFFQYWLLCIYLEGIGKLIGTLLLDHVTLAIILSQLIYSLMCLLNGFYIDLDGTESKVVIETANVIAIRFITKNMIYTFYGIDRCDPEREFSWIMLNNNVDPNQIPYNALRVVANIVIVQLVTLLVMFLKFNTFNLNPLTKLVRSYRKQTGMPETISIDDENVSIDLSKQNIERVKEQNEIEFDEFSKNKIIIAWRDLTLYGSSSIYEIGSSNVKRPEKILRNLNGQFEFGTLNALMGTSGAGKTSLLKVLNGRDKTRLSDETRFYLSRFTKIETCFITQEVSGHLMPGLTAKQSLIYASRLKNFDVANVDDHEKIAFKVLDALDLMDTANTKVDRCSGGERKRLALALELTSTQMPNLICIDEPTSGLDSNSAETVISCLHKLVQTHSLTIIASIHQPNTSILFMFDQLYVLARGGVCIYSGPPSQVQSHLNQIELSNRTASRFAIENLINYSCLNHENQNVQQMVDLTDQQYDQNQLTEHTQLVPDGVVRNRTRFSLNSVLILSFRFLSYIRGFLWFPMLFYICNYLIFAYILSKIFDPQIAYPSGCVSPDEDISCAAKSFERVHEIKQLTNNYRYSFYMTSVCMFNLVFNSALQFSIEFGHFKNEHRNGWYSSGSFYLVHCIIEIIPTIPLMMAHVYICNIYEDVRPGMYWSLFGLFLLAAIALQGMSHMISLLANGDIRILTSLVVLLYMSSTLVANFFLSFTNLHYFYQFASNISILRFIFEATMLLQYGFGRCRPREIQSVLYTMALNDGDFSHCVLMLVFNLVLFRVITIALLLYRMNPVENRRQRVTLIVQHNQQLKTQITDGIGSTNQQFRIKLAQTN